MQDPDAPGGTFTHWIVFNLPPSVTSLAEDKQPPGGSAGRNDAGTQGYFGPKPPSGTHHYVFRVYALDAKLTLPDGATISQLVGQMQGHVLAMGELTGLYSR